MNVADQLGLGPTRVAKQNEGQQTWTVYVTPNKLFLPEAKTHHVILTDDQYRRYTEWLGSGQLIQYCLPDLAGSVRELLLSGLTDEDLAGFDDEDDDDEYEVD